MDQHDVRARPFACGTTAFRSAVATPAAAAALARRTGRAQVARAAARAVAGLRTAARVAVSAPGNGQGEQRRCRRDPRRRRCFDFDQRRRIKARCRIRGWREQRERAAVRIDARAQRRLLPAPAAPRARAHAGSGCQPRASSAVFWLFMPRGLRPPVAFQLGGLSRCSCSGLHCAAVAGESVWLSHKASCAGCCSGGAGRLLLEVGAERQRQRQLAVASRLTAAIALPIRAVSAPSRTWLIEGQLQLHIDRASRPQRGSIQSKPGSMQTLSLTDPSGAPVTGATIVETSAMPDTCTPRHRAR